MLSERLKQLRLSKNLSQKQIADNIKASERTYQRYEYGQRNPDSDTIVLLCAYLEVSADYLLGISDNPKINK